MADWGLDLPSPFAGRYEILRELGHGASAVVYLVHDQQHDRDVALKVLSPDYASALGPARFLREIRLVSRLQHPYIVPVLDSGESDGRLYFVMPLVEGHPLRARMAREGQLPVADAVRYATEIADALQHAHDHGVLHRDVKPENILLSGQHACLADFGIARALTPVTGDEITTTGVILGTPTYMSPEQASTDKGIDGRSDQYALACVLFEMLAGVPPFVGPNEQSIIAQRFHHAPPPVRHYRQTVDPVLEDVLARALQLGPADRFPTVREFAAALTAGQHPPSSEMHALAGRSTRTWPWRPLAAIALLAVTVGTWWKLSEARDTEVPRSFSQMVAEPGPGVSEDARSTYLQARRTLASGNLVDAAAGFAKAAAADPTFALAHLWLAQTLQWQSGSAELRGWSAAAAKAMRSPNRPSPRDAHHARALVALANSQFPEACAEFEEVVRVDSLSFVGWFGLGECRRLDHAVVRHANSPSGWKFRAEYSAAIAAYSQALANAPDASLAPIFQRSLQVTLTEPTALRRGYAVAPDTTTFLAYPALEADTLAFVPFRASAVASLGGSTAPRSFARALERAREIELALTREWVRRMSRSADALAALALALESTGRLSGADAPSDNALAAIRAARAVPHAKRADALFRAAEVRVLMKSREFKAAATLADSTIRTSDTMADSVAKTLASLAALLGRPKEMASHLRALWSEAEFSRADFGLVVPPDLAQRMADLVADVEGGTCTTESVAVLTGAVDSVIANVYEPKRRSIVRSALLDDVRIRAAPCTRGVSAPPPSASRPYATLVAAAVKHDLPAVSAILSRIDALRESHSRSQVSWDVVSLEGWALASGGDLLRAAARIDSSLSGLRYSSAHLTSQPRLAGGLRRTLVLRAAIARESGDTEAAKYWQQAIEELSVSSR